MKEELRSIAAIVFGVEEKAITEDTSQLNTSSWTSLAHVTLISAVEQEFGVRLETSDIVKIKSLRDLSDIIDVKRAQD